MFLGVLFMFSSIIFGAAFSKILKMKFTLEERICFSILFGISVSTILVYAFSFMQKRLDLTSITAGTALILVASFLMIKWRNIFGGSPLSKELNFENAVVAMAGTAAFIALNLICVLREEFNSIYGSLYVCGDYSFHVSLTSSFVYRNNFPPHYPIIVDTPMGYPVIVDFLSAILMKTGFDLQSSMIIPNVLFQASTLCLISALANRIFKRKYVGALSAFLFFFAGNMGIIYAVQDMLKHGDLVGWITNLPTDYSGSGISDLPEIRFGNPVAVMLLPQRASPLGIGLSLLVYILVFFALQSEENFRELIFAGILVGLLPAIHSHSFIAVVIATFFIILKFKRGLRFFAAIFVPAAVLALPQILIIQAHMEGGFIGLTIGWLGLNAERIMSLNWSTPLNVLLSAVQSVLLLLRFWLMNIGVVILPFIFGYKKSDQAIRGFYPPFLMLFIAGNFVRFQPWDWDNYKIFLHWYIVTLIFASFGIVKIADFAFKDFKLTFKLRKPSKQFLRPPFGVAALAAILFFATATGFLSCAKMVQESYLIWSEADLAFASWIRENTPPESIFLTSTHYSHPVVSVGGRQIVLGYEGWLWSHGISLKRIQEVRSDIIEMFKGNYTLIRKYGVNFIAVTPYERDFAAYNGFKINLDFFDKSEYFKKAYNEILDGKEYIIFKVLS
ncbi:MAG: hypothetical protein RMJ15_06755 [Nitrososphaerota archaeon]|nr:hypothetical protein [Nitrososphaerota archaeon]